ncbi:MAG: hypothetical protein ACYCQJ_05115 [Nitrososphaerales archaeon]
MSTRAAPRLVALLCFSLLLTLLFLSFASSASADSVTVSVTPDQAVYFSAPASSNFTVLSITGNQGYLIQTTPGIQSNQLTFTPTNGTYFSIIVNVSSFANNYVNISRQGSALSTFSKNFTGYGNLIVQVIVNVSSSGVSPAFTWDPLVGILPLKLASFSFNFLTVMESLALIGAFFLALGIVLHSRLSYFGLAILFLAGAITLGILLVLGIVGFYLFGFAVVNVVWRFKSWKRRE